MVNRVVSTKLTEVEHAALLDTCNTQGQTPSSFIKAAIMEKLKPTAQPDAVQEIPTELDADDMSAKEKQQSEPVKTKPESPLMKLARVHKNSRPAEISAKGESELMKLMRIYRMQKTNAVKT